jgi:hypothetical protein
MHHWIKPQRKDKSGNYYGPFELILQCGRNKLLLKKSKSSIFCKMSTTDNPRVNYDLFVEASQILELTLDDLISNFKKGNYLLVSDKMIVSTVANGFYVKIDRFPDIRFHPQDVSFEKVYGMDMISLYDRQQRKIMSTHMGLLATDYVPTIGEFPEIIVDGLYLTQLSELRIFSNNFSFDYINKETCLDILQDLNVNRPRISAITKSRLSGIVDRDWPEKNWNDQMIETETQVIEEKMNPQFDMTEFMDADIDETFLENMDFEIDQFDDYLDPDIDLNIMSALSMTRIKFQPAIIWERFLSIKYNLIARSCVDLQALSKDTIRWVYAMTKNKGIAYSLIYMYDKIYVSEDMRSPPYSSIVIFNNFLDKFNLNIPEMMLD